ncbi:MAG: glycine cleavage system protein GcvH [Clostridia bacterium]|nr:glycine cleavage system protein GcvH [Clostridia bacterium]
MTPNDRYYTKDHEWILVEGNRAKIGISDHAQDALGDIVYVELPDMDATYDAGESFAVVESVKAVSQIYTAVGGRVVEINEALNDQPELINSDCYNQFIAVFEFENLNTNELLTAEQYEAFVSEG